MKNAKEKSEQFEEIKIIMDKQFEIEKLRKKTNIFKNIIAIFAGIATLGFLGFVCFMMYKQSFTMETLLAVLLSFFSIGLSVMFYIQADKSNSQFYRDSYQIMKDVSVALGKIESGMGEKLSNIETNISDLKNKGKETKEEIASKEKEKEELEQELIKKAKSEQEKRALINELNEKNKEIDSLNRKNRMIEQKLKNFRNDNFLRNSIKYNNDYLDFTERNIKNKNNLSRDEIIRRLNDL